MTYNVYKIKYTITIPDPDMPTPRWHHEIFVCTSPPSTGFGGGGTTHHVTGDITAASGMYYETRPCPTRPEDIETFHSREFLGTVKRDQYPAEMDRVLRALTPPPKQKAFNVKTMRTEQVKLDGEREVGFYQVGEERPRMVKCTEWTVEQAIPALYEAGVLTL